MKHLLCLLLALAAAFSLTACAAPEADTPTTAPAVTDATVEASAAATETAAPESTAAPFVRAPGSYKECYNSGKSSESWMEYYIHIPEGATENMPLVVFLHGDGEVGLIDDLESYGLIESAKNVYGEEFPFITISPCTRIYSWIQEDVSLLLKEIIDSVVKDYAIDENRIIITGHSRGAIGTWDLISRYGDFFSAAVPVSCNNENPLNLKNAAKVPVWGFVGDQGDIEKKYADYMGQAVDLLVNAGGDAKLTQLEEHWHIDTDTGAYTEEVFEWMLSFNAPTDAPDIRPEDATEPSAPEETVPPITEEVFMPVLYGDPLGVDAGTYQKTYNSTFYGRSMDYCMFVPDNATENMPLIVYLHGDSEVNRIDDVADIEMVKQAKEIYGDSFPFLVLAPNTNEKSWIEFHIYNVVYDMIEEIAKEYKVDPSKIILTGHSRGAIGTWYYMNMNYYYQSFTSDIDFSCFVPVSHYAAYPINAELSARKPIWTFSGDADGVEKECIEKLEGDIQLIKNAGGDITMTVLEGSTHGETEKTAYTKETFEWMLAQ